MVNFIATVFLLFAGLKSLPDRAVTVEVIGLDGRLAEGVEVLLIDARLRQPDRNMKTEVFAYHPSEIILRVRTSSSGMAVLNWPQTIDVRRLWAVATIGDRVDARPLSLFSTVAPVLRLRPQRASIVRLRATSNQGGPAAHAALHIYDFTQFCVPSGTDNLDQHLGPDGSLTILRSLVAHDVRPLRFRLSGERGQNQFEIAAREGRFDADFRLAESAPATPFSDPLGPPPVVTRGVKGPSWRLRFIVPTSITEVLDNRPRVRITSSSGALVAEGGSWHDIVLAKRPEGPLELSLSLGEEPIIESMPLDFQKMSNGGQIEVPIEGLRVWAPLLVDETGLPLRGESVGWKTSPRQLMSQTDFEGRIRLVLSGKAGPQLGRASWLPLNPLDLEAERIIVRQKKVRLCRLRLDDPWYSRVVRDYWRVEILFVGDQRNSKGNTEEKITWQGRVLAIHGRFRSRPMRERSDEFSSEELPEPGSYLVLARQSFIGARPGLVELGALDVPEDIADTGVLGFHPTSEALKLLEDLAR